MAVGRFFALQAQAGFIVWDSGADQTLFSSSLRKQIVLIFKKGCAGPDYKLIRLKDFKKICDLFVVRLMSKKHLLYLIVWACFNALVHSRK